MDGIQQSFFIGYYGVTIRVTPIVEGLSMQYRIYLPTRTLTIEMTDDYTDEVTYWTEVPGGKTEVASEIGDLIESRDM